MFHFKPNKLDLYDEDAKSKSSKVISGKFIGYCSSCDLMLMEQDKTGGKVYSCPRCGAKVATPREKPMIPTPSWN